MSTIRPLTAADAIGVAALHQEALRSTLTGQSGRALLACYYRALADGVGGQGFIASNGAAIGGFVCGIWAPETLRCHLLRQQGLRLGLWALIHLVAHPSRLLTLPSRFLDGGDDSVVAGYELRPIAVAAPLRGRGVADALVDELVEDARRRGYEEIYLFTECDNEPANRFYQRRGFVRCRRLQRGDTTYLRYVLRTGHA